ncbi:MAG: RpiB/LacA/LacB family sugar-phosphate isomerase, partial [Elusimicrobia bacterium]|nr:RpiB/LacA/LacB family sugar-phosphate isomerase [Elusimicrobiota bacterium]
GLAGVRHASRALDERLLDEADAVYALSREHRDEIVRRFPALAAKTAVLREAAGLPGPDVPDPVGEDDAVYEACAARIEEALDVLIRRSSHAENAR